MNKVDLDKKVMFSILENNLKREYKTLSKFACLSNQAQRLRLEPVSDKENIRPSFFHDTDRILHSHSYTRYIDKTQVFYLFENDHITHRVLHVQLVSKIAKVIGRALKLNEDLIEAISLAHDLGHVPYGHNGERRLNKIVQEKFNMIFSHNAQSVRIVKDIENNGYGLNLSIQVLDGILCHNGELMLNKYEPNYSKTMDDFINEYDNCWKIKGYDKKLIPMTLEGCVMRISDIIAYLGRDFEDAITLGIIERESLPKNVKEILGDNNKEIINKIVLDIINNSYEKGYILMSDNIYNAIMELYDFSIQNIYRNPNLTVQDDKINFMFDYLFEKYIKDLEAKTCKTSISNSFLSNMSDIYTDKSKNHQIVIDYIAGMTDKYFNEQFKDSLFVNSFGRHI